MCVAENCINVLMKMKKQSKPLIDYYQMKKELTNINGAQTMEDVYKDIKKCLEGKK